MLHTLLLIHVSAILGNCRGSWVGLWVGGTKKEGKPENVNIKLTSWFCSDALDCHQEQSTRLGRLIWPRCIGQLFSELQSSASNRWTDAKNIGLPPNRFADDQYPLVLPAKENSLEDDHKQLGCNLKVCNVNLTRKCHELSIYLRAAIEPLSCKILNTKSSTTLEKRPSFKKCKLATRTWFATTNSIFWFWQSGSFGKII